jgi:phosphoglycerol transferase MdoB-like AlkP superfamily enzyme
VVSKAYHDHSYTYYQRNETHTNLGYLWKAKGNGLELPTDCWPESDLEMIDATVEEYSMEPQFHIYYLTVSGHMNYTFLGNSMSYKNKALVQELPYSEEGKAYLACQIELDRALETLIKKLDDAGIAERTVIAMSTDHYPYSLKKNTLYEMAGHEVDQNFELYKNNFILWCEGMKENIVIDKPCSSLDILPTLSNLFGLEYDSRLLMGQDILSDAEPLVVLANRSFITDKVQYNSATGETTLLTQDPLPENYIDNVNKIVKNKFTISRSILEEDYYRSVFPE